MAKENAATLVTPVGILSFPNLAEKTSEEFGAKFKCELLIDMSQKENAKAVQRLVDAAEAMYKKAYPKKSFDKFLDSKDSPICVPGLEFHDELVEEGKIGANVARIKMSNTRRPFLKLPDTSLVIDAQEIEEEFYAGCKCRAAFTMYTWGGGYIGVSFSMQTVQKVGEGKPLGQGLKDYEFDKLELPYDGDDDEVPAPKKAKKADDDDDDEI